MSYLELDVRQMDEKQWTYTKIIEQELDRLGGIANLSTLYDAVYTNWSFKVANKPNWEARVRATLQESPMFINIERGVWGLSDRNFSTSKKWLISERDNGFSLNQSKEQAKCLYYISLYLLFYFDLF